MGKRMSGCQGNTANRVSAGSCRQTKVGRSAVQEDRWYNGLLGRVRDTCFNYASSEHRSSAHRRSDDETC